jgi:hypothetical protein
LQPVKKLTNQKLLSQKHTGAFIVAFATACKIRGLKANNHLTAKNHGGLTRKTPNDLK